MLFGLPYFMMGIMRPFSAPCLEEGDPSFCRKLLRWLWIAVGLEAVSGLAWLWFVAARADLAPGWALPTGHELVGVLWDSPFGQLWLVRAALGIAFTFVLYLVSRQRTLFRARSLLLNSLIVSLSGCLLISLAWASHHNAGIRGQVLHLLADTPHLLIAAVWPMGLIPMAYFLWHIHRSGSPAAPADQHVQTLQRFSQTSLIAVLILLATGGLNGWLTIGSWENLLGTVYGWLLLCKVLVVLVMIGIGAFNRFQLLPRIHDMPCMFTALRRTLLAESCLGLVVLVIVGMHT